ncbi:LacI family DNA-binding transcriptional regulator [Amycolatopsis jiangsuensis]|uniref:LacI family transcriptional regulator n=1 Tax=Amycolatopsis jiangsuensis TaxID=1181879 RepID=A0A840INB1_9PSEU|nr:LacI family DNA-binding transcriptional regulator [Amycolatopsis jiangsuensis]MBB4683846.1 LacI family transcriptional regulator [Amycolatopsis jiangsuensis]
MAARRSSERTSPVTLEQLAREAGVHVSTVSRALRAEPVGVGPETVARIRELAHDLGYRRDPAAHALRTGHTRTIGVLVPRLTDVAMATIFDGIDETARLGGYDTVVANTHDDPEERRSRVESLLSMRVAGLVLADSRSDANVVAQLRRSRVPYVLVMRRLPKQVAVTTDDEQGGRLAAEHLLERGHRRVGVVAGDQAASTGVERTHGFRETFARAGHPVPAEYVVESGFGVSDGRRATEQILALPSRPTAIFAVNDFTAVGAMGAIRDAGLRVGQDVALVGYNDLDLAAELPVALTSVRSPLAEMGRVSARMLLDLVGGRRIASRRFAPTLSIRDSSLGHVVPPS